MFENEIRSMNEELGFFIEDQDRDGIREIFRQADRMMVEIDLCFPGEGDDLRDAVAEIMDRAIDALN